ncbi:MAG: hypothetical protein JWR11_4533 [Mycobacterium sp.]|jgi:hypothetical protein|nr:hypothetical protein [Mycobacterium sp.]MDT5176162.1 hypothetical protein [Mycobacterium sp.]
MAQADYAFEECDGGFLRYQVSCVPCSYVYVEDCVSPPTNESAA